MTRDCYNVPEMIRVGEHNIIDRKARVIYEYNEDGPYCEKKQLDMYEIGEGSHSRAAAETWVGDEASAFWAALCDWSYNVA